MYFIKRTNILNQQSYLIECNEDNGIGMEEKVLTHIFDKFYQGDTSRATQGNGLGLSLVKKIIDLSNGTINATSKINHGTTFIIELYNQNDPSQGHFVIHQSVLF